MNNKGFTMIEVLAAFLLLGILATFATFSVIDYLEAADESALTTLKENIKSGMINYYNECKYLSTGVCDLTKEDGTLAKNGTENIPVLKGKDLTTTIADLRNKGFLENQGETTTIKNPVSEKDITKCKVQLTYNDGGFSIEISGDVIPNSNYSLTEAEVKACNSTDLEY